MKIYNTGLHIKLDLKFDLKFDFKFNLKSDSKFDFKFYLKFDLVTINSALSCIKFKDFLTVYNISAYLSLDRFASQFTYFELCLIHFYALSST